MVEEGWKNLVLKKSMPAGQAPVDEIMLQAVSGPTFRYKIEKLSRHNYERPNR